jgi:hypothetical protein
MPRARAVADAPIEPLLAACDELARRWLVALVAARPLEQIADLPLEALALQAPPLFRQVVHALGSDAELHLLLGEGERHHALEQAPPGGARHALALVALDPSTLAASIEALRSVLWRRALGELRDPPTALVADLGDRLAFVCASLLAVALDAGSHTETAAARAAVRGGAARAPYGRAAAPAGRGGGAVLIDELEAEPRPLADDRPAHAARRTADGERPSAPASTAGRARARPWDTPLRDDPSGGKSVRPEAQAVPGENEPQLRVRRTSAVPIDELS